MNKGFSLIELLAVVGITGILSTMAYPSYRHHIIRVHRHDGQTALLDLANRLEHYYAENNTYQTATIGDGKETDILNSNHSAEGWYKLTIRSANETGYSLLATPSGSQAIYDSLCQSLTFNNHGEKGIAAGPKGNPTGTTEQCW